LKGRPALITPTPSHPCHHRANVKYRVKAECVTPGLKFNLRHKAYLTVHQQLDRPPSEFRASHSQEVKKCCCFGQGSVNVIANVQKDS
jgi:hypothetical protein